MYPVLFRIGQFKVWSYGFFYMLALVLGFILFIIRGRKQGYNLDFLINFILFEFVMTFIGCKLFFIFLNPRYYQSLSELFAIQKGGFVFYGGILTGLISGFLYLRIKKQNPWAIFDIATPLMFLTIFTGRIGCFLKGCCWGTICNFKSLCVIFPRDSDPYNDHLSRNLIDKNASYSLPVYPIQLYESVISGILFIYFWEKYRHRKYDGQIMMESLLAYAVERFFVDFLRGDVTHIFYLSFSQFVSIIFFIVIITYFLKLKKK